MGIDKLCRLGGCASSGSQNDLAFFSGLTLELSESSLAHWCFRPACQAYLDLQTAWIRLMDTTWELPARSLQRW